MKNEADEIKQVDEKSEDMLAKKEMKRAKRKSRRRIIWISTMVCIAVFIIGGIANIAISMKMAFEYSAAKKLEVEITIPNGHIGEEYDRVGFLGGRSDYKLAKMIDGRVKYLSTETNGFGIFTNGIYMMTTSVWSENGKDGWPQLCWESGDRKMLFFHPKLEYNFYKNDLPILDKLSNVQALEMGLSFDKGYSEWEVGKLLSGFNVTWVWVDDYSEEKLNKMKDNIEQHEDGRQYVQEKWMFGIGIHDNIINDFENDYKSTLNDLKQYIPWRYKALQEVGLDEFKNVKIIGVTVQGTPEELKALSEVKQIKGATIGCKVNIY